MQNKNCQKSPVQKPSYPSFPVNYPNMKYLSPDKIIPRVQYFSSHTIQHKFYLGQCPPAMTQETINSSSTNSNLVFFRSN